MMISLDEIAPQCQQNRTCRSRNAVWRKGSSAMDARHVGLICGCTLAALLAGANASASVTVGTFTGQGNCFPFNCNDSGVTSGQSIDYEQMYSSTAFATTTTFNQITFNAFAGAGNGSVISGNYDIIFGTTTQALGSGYPLTLSNTQTFFDGALSSGGGATFSIDGSSYTYNPADGNLVMEVVVTNQANVPNGSGNSYFQADTSGSVMSRAYLITGAAGVSDGTSLVTTFGAVPEPAAWALMLAGFAGLGGALRSRRRQIAATV
ncbi:MAG TPA: PEPxxWA-CTERM sorting domain-containing protein [Caulobacteraceae bacterium]|jgi:hypothetical protein